MQIRAVYGIVVGVLCALFCLAVIPAVIFTTTYFSATNWRLGIPWPFTAVIVAVAALLLWTSIRLWKLQKAYSHTLWSLIAVTLFFAYAVVAIVYSSALGLRVLLQEIPLLILFIAVIGFLVGLSFASVRSSLA